MAAVIEELDFSFYFILINSKLKIDTRVIRKLLAIFGTIGVCESTSSTLNFMTSTYRSGIAKKNFAFELKSALSIKYTLDFEG